MIRTPPPTSPQPFPGSSPVSSFYLRLGITGSFWVLSEQMATGVRVGRMWWMVLGLGPEAGKDGGCRGVSLLARDLQLLIWEKRLKASTRVPFIPCRMSFSAFFSILSSFLSICSPLLRHISSHPLTWISLCSLKTRTTSLRVFRRVPFPSSLFRVRQWWGCIWYLLRSKLQHLCSLAPFLLR